MSVTIYHNPACGTSRNTLAHPILINRPIVVTPKGARLCRPSELDGEAIARARNVDRRQPSVFHDCAA